MAGGTHVFDMIKRLRENENLRKLNYFKKTGKRYPASGGTTSADERVLTNEETRALIYTIKRGQRTETLRRFLILVVSALVFGLLVLIVLKYMS